MDVTSVLPEHASSQHGFTDFLQSDTMTGHTNKSEEHLSAQPPVNTPADHPTISFEDSISFGASPSDPVAPNVVASPNVETTPQPAVTEGDADVLVVDERPENRPRRPLPSRFRRAVPSSSPKQVIPDVVKEGLSLSSVIPSLEPVLDDTTPAISSHADSGPETSAEETVPTSSVPSSEQILDSETIPEVPASSTADPDDGLEYDSWSSGSSRSSTRSLSPSPSSNIYEEDTPASVGQHTAASLSPGYSLGPSSTTTTVPHSTPSGSTSVRHTTDSVPSSSKQPLYHPPAPNQQPAPDLGAYPAVVQKSPRADSLTPSPLPARSPTGTGGPQILLWGEIPRPPNVNSGTASTTATAGPSTVARSTPPQYCQGPNTKSAGMLSPLAPKWASPTPQYGARLAAAQPGLSSKDFFQQLCTMDAHILTRPQST